MRGVCLEYNRLRFILEQGQTVNGLKQAILENNYFLPDYLSGPCIDLIRAILKRDPAERITMAGIRGSEWLHGQVRLQTLPTYQFVPSEPGVEVCYNSELPHV